MILKDNSNPNHSVILSNNNNNSNNNIVGFFLNEILNCKFLGKSHNNFLKK